MNGTDEQSSPPETGRKDLLPATSGRAGWNPARVVGVIVGVVLGLGSLGLIGAGGFALAVSSQNDGYVDLGSGTVSTEGYALSTDTWNAKTSMLGILGTVRVQFTPDNPTTPAFLGLASPDTVDHYLAGVNYVTVHRNAGHGTTSETHQGGAPATRPAKAGSWVAQASGTGTQTLSWAIQPGDYQLVAMNADGAASVAGHVSMGATVPALHSIGIGVLAAGVLLLVGGIVLIVFVTRRARRTA